MKKDERIEDYRAFLKAQKTYWKNAVEEYDASNNKLRLRDWAEGKHEACKQVLEKFNQTFK